MGKQERKQMPIIDLHCDTISRLYEANGEEQLNVNSFHVDLQKLKQGGYTLQTFALFVDTAKCTDPYENAIEQFRLFQKEMNNNKDMISHVTTFEQYKANKAKGRLSALLSIEEGAVCKESRKVLKDFYEKGVRMMTLTWNYPNKLASPNDFPGYKKGCSCMQANTKDGLTATGREFVEEMAKLSMILDVSHLGDRGIYDVLQLSKGPVIASHSNGRRICGHVRNLNDDMIAAIAGRGGIIGVNFYPFFLENKPKEQCKCTIEILAKHIRHLQKVGGTECVALGTDFDGMDGELEIADASQMPKLWRGLQACGFGEQELEGICFKNAERFLRETL